MYSPATRLLTLLELLQARSGYTATQLAERLEVNTRSIRRYITQLQDLGIPVESERGRYGGYRLRPGFKLPPLMWTEEEAVAITLGLHAARQFGLAGTAPAIEGALAKVERILPSMLREQVQAMQEYIVLDAAPPNARATSEHIALLSMAAHRQQRVWIAYCSKEDKLTEREFDCYALLYYNEHWYASGFCHLRQGIRLFRLDRITQVEERKAYFERPQDFDALNHAIRSILTMPARWLVEVVLKAELEQISQAIPATFATLQETPEGILLRAYDDDLEHMARFLVKLGCPFRVQQPPELLDALQSLADQISQLVGLAQISPVL
ncbi:YafY family transcriptional regulator [Ktedonosporobacter rubrisoli]|uniref:YafY family transcriptional regulator n=1 Tax=Ktedonosporobacter rubrisoli TaxID=2509675 RepID=A0A4P6JMT1_KTERU|nr:YafY family protein [Ktedonosporobacter rubrisoli]QBD76342.1 YafY family transcriptional regulator [Ktedonosporobacter rubrisoli]